MGISYIISWLAHKSGLLSCNTAGLRSLNANLWPLGGLAAFYIVFASQQLTLEKGRKVLQTLHTAVNVCLFPPIWFFTGLYYTDVASTVFVLFTLAVFYNRTRIPLSGLLVFLLGALSLLFRQTNIFWVAIFPAGLAVVSELEKLPDQKRPYDALVGHAVVSDYVSVLFSIVRCIVGQLVQSPFFLLRLATALWPFASLIALFAGFVVWNGGVVLGDKSNHVATIHLPQVLYLFAYMAFFSLPLILPALSAAVLGERVRQLDMLAPYAGQFRPRKSAHAQGKSDILAGSIFDLGSVTVVFLFTICFALPAIHFNTIIHPFTLADNRHYVFYVFRILRLYPALRYAAAPAYIICAWLVVQQLSALPIETKPDKVSGGVTSGMTGDAATAPRVSFVLVWFATSALCLVTAPLVEPRYFILPWIVWRLHVQSPGMTPAGEKELEKQQANGLSRLRVLYHGDYRFYAETAWFILIDGATAYIFLNWGFEWPQEPGAVQRFLW